MPRGDCLKNRRCRNKGGTNRFWMPPSRDTVFVSSNINEKQLEDNWKKAFGSSRSDTNGGWECTCNDREVKTKDATIYIKDDCAIHGKGEKRRLVVTDIQKKFPKRHIQKLCKEVIYGNGEIRDITHRRT